MAKRRSLPLVDGKVRASLNNPGNQRSCRPVFRQKSRTRRAARSLRSRACIGTQTHRSFRALNDGFARGVRHADTPLRRSRQDHVELPRCFLLSDWPVRCAAGPVRKTGPPCKGDARVDAERSAVNLIPLYCHLNGEGAGVGIPLIAIHHAKVQAGSSRRYEITPHGAARRLPVAD